MTDHDIIQLIQQQKHSKAFSRLYRYFNPVQKLILARGGSKDDALDVYQDALVILCKRVCEPGFKLTASLDTYLYSVSRFLWNDELKRRGKMHEQEITERTDLPEEEIQEWTKDEEKIGMAQSILEKLGKRCLQLLQLFYTEDKSMKEIARKMEFTSENVAKNQKYKCLERAKNMLRESELKATKI
jgi:RNA polymerase sigma factor (sigma-70 family)